MKPMSITAVAVLLTTLNVSAHKYTADDFCRLVKSNPLVVAGTIHGPTAEGTDTAGGITIQEVLKNEIRGVTLKAGDEVPLSAASNNVFWAKAVVHYEPGQVGVWILNATAQSRKLLPAEIVAHFSADQSTLAPPPSGKRETPLEQWGATDQVGQWGVVNAPNTGGYTLKGKFLGVSKAGSVVDVLTVTNSPAGELAVCRPDAPLDDQEAEVVILTSNLNIHPGSLAKLDEKRKTLCVREAEIEARIQEVTDNLVEKGATGNPYAMEYRRTKATYDQFWAKVKNLQARRNAARGASRMDYIDELRQMKGEDIRVGKAFMAARQKYEAWQARQGNKKIKSPEIDALEKELAAVREQIRQLR